MTIVVVEDELITETLIKIKKDAETIYLTVAEAQDLRDFLMANGAITITAKPSKK